MAPAVASVLLDTGPLVALFKRNDTFHKKSVDWFARNRAELVTTHAVLTEAWHLISPPAPARKRRRCAVEDALRARRRTPLAHLASLFRSSSLTWAGFALP